MKNKISGSGDSVFKKKGFFIALYSCLGAVMVLALVISFTNLMADPSGGATARGKSTDTQSNSQNVNADQVDSYLAKAQEQAQAELDAQAWKKPTAKPSVTAAPVNPPVTGSPAVTQPPTAPVVPIPAATPSQSSQPNAAPETSSQSTDEPASVQEERSDDTSTVDAQTQSDDLAFAPFTESDKLIWPVYGDIAMVFSMDKLVYDPTLDQYRTNDDLRIAAQEGTPVKACAEGKVLEVDNDHVYGNYVKIDHGNGWVTTYGQLMDGVLVTEGEIIKTGQVIGGVGKPSLYGSLNGSHVNLRVTKENEPVDPQGLLVDGQ